MPQIKETNEKDRLQEGVFQPSRAEIAREMKCRLDLECSEEERPEHRNEISGSTEATDRPIPNRQARSHA